MKKLLIIVFLMFPIISQANVLRDITEQLRFLSQRDKILSNNIANIDTPKYKPVDLENNTERQNIGLATTHSKHIAISNSTSFDLVDGEIIELKANGNAVTAEYELFKKNENAIQFQEATNLYNKSRNMIKTAIVGVK